MIRLERLHGAGGIIVNADLIETVEACPDTTITLLTRRKFVVANSVDDVIDQVVAFRQRTNAGAGGSVRTALEFEHPRPGVHADDSKAA